MDKKLAGLISLFFLAFFVFMSVLVFGKPLSRYTRAAEDSQPSGSKTLIFAWPLTSPPAQPVKVDVFVRSESGKPVESREVILRSTLGSVEPGVNVSGKDGKTSFTLTSSTNGVAELSAVIDNSIPVEQKVSVKFE
jgi:hypothetical protein